MLLKLIHTIQVLDAKFWTYNPYFKSELPFLMETSQESLKQFTILCDFIKVFIKTSEIEINDAILCFGGQKMENLDIYTLRNLIEATNSNELLLAKYLLSKINPYEIEQLLVKLDVNLLKLAYESK
jgi:hypothetical protein